MRHDRDVMLMNLRISLGIFLLLEAEFGHINLLVTKDLNGLSNGVFLVRVSQWEFKMFANALIIRE